MTIPVPTAAGRVVPLRQVAAGDVSVRGLAHQLATMSLWAGATFLPYSPAQRGVLMSQLFSDAQEALYALLHPAPLAFTGIVEPGVQDTLERDVPGAAEWLAFTRRRIQCAIRLAVGVPIDPPGGLFDIELAQVERVMVATEIRDLLAQDVIEAQQRTGLFGPMPMPLRERIVAWKWTDAEDRWLRKFRQLAQVCGLDPDRSDRRDPSPFVHQEAIAP